MTRLVIDTDPGVDDAHAILLAFAHPAAEVEAITTVAGNVPLERTTENAKVILDVLGRDVPIFAGCDRPLVKPRAHASYVHGEDGLGGANLPPSTRKIEAEHAVNALVRMANEAPGELTLVAIAPLTNIALALRLDPALPQKYKRLVVMGGAIRAMGNSANPSTEFNVFTDPEAAAIVFEGWPGLTLISWETTVAYALSREQVLTLMAMKSPRADFFRRITIHTLEFIEQRLGRRALFAPDPLAIAVALSPEIVRQVEKRFVQVELAGRHTYGQTTVDWFDLTGQPANVEIILEVDAEQFWEMVQASLR